MTQPINVLFREIHKNAWLKKLPPTERRNGAFPKKGERVWVVFCVHDDSEAFLEVYTDQKLAVTHKPDWFVSLNNCLHVSPTICAQEDEYEFVITLSSDVIRLTAPSWEVMMEWVETIRSKLQEMRILSPRENLYSKMPEVRLPLAPTRDPNSPLPPPPVGPSSIVPGIEPVRLENSASAAGSLETAAAALSGSSAEESAVPRTVHNSVNLEIRTTAALYITQSEPAVYTRPRHSLNRAASVPESPSSFTSSLVTPPHARNSPSSNVTVIEVSSSAAPPHSALPLETPGVFNFNSVNTLQNSSSIDSDSSVQESNLNRDEPSERGPCVSPLVRNHPSPQTNSEDSGHRPNGDLNRTYSGSLQDLSETLGHYECVFLPTQPSTVQQEPGITTTPSTTVRSRSSESNPNYVAAMRTPGISNNQMSEQNVPISQQELAAAELSGSVVQQRRRSRSTSLSEGVAALSSRTAGERNERSRGGASAVPVRSDSERRVHGNGTSVRNDAERRLQPATTSGTPARTELERRLQPATTSGTSVRAEGERRLQPATASGTSVRTEERRLQPATASGTPARTELERRLQPTTSSGTAARTEGERRLQPAPHPYRQAGTSVAVDRLTLREQQVLQLRREMLHPGGVRLQLRRKDCTNSIALVDAFGAVWVAGWKQKEHPMLYNALHIGDQLLSTGGVLVQSASDAQKLIRGASSLYVEFVIRRVPCGRVFAIRRDAEGQCLGIVQESNTAEIRDVVPGSPAARHGLVPRAQTCDGLSLTNWVLTEINGRPLNLFFKDGEVRDRLNAVGRDISILVQPADLVKQLKKQLKAIRSYKDYIVQ